MKSEGKYHLNVQAEKKKNFCKLFWMDSMDWSVPHVSLKPEDKIIDGISKERKYDSRVLCTANLVLNSKGNRKILSSL